MSNVDAIKDYEGFSFIERRHYQIAAASIRDFKEQANLK